MSLRNYALVAAIGLLLSYLIFTASRIIGDLMPFESYDQFRYAFRVAFYLADILNYFPLIIFFMAFYLSRKGTET
ncbi:MAG: hypothetical protein LC731_03430, partial [Acidobacteria bacterium]|nr:hypothetical protein [Acidobacteriota bacterium]